MWNNFILSLEIMGKGMGGIFAAILVILAAVWVLGRITGKQEEKKKS